MKRRHGLMLLGLAVLLLPIAARAQPAAPKLGDRNFGPDKVKHFFVVGFVESMTFAGLQALGANRGPARAGAISAAVVISLGREIHDRRTKGLFSFRDLAWDAIGASAALLVINKTQH
ncbi:MAG: hypothetical protein ABIS03_09200 [Gemmatimonadaceae bacterium]